jgi:hypothetical protein
METSLQPNSALESGRAEERRAVQRKRYEKRKEGRTLCSKLASFQSFFAPLLGTPE